MANPRQSHSVLRYHGVIRTCIGCRQPGPANQLLRIVAVKHQSETDDEPDDAHRLLYGARYVVVVDPARRLPGRGAWLHLDPVCVASAIRRRAFGRALRVTGELDLHQLVEHVASSYVESNVKAR